MSGFKLKRRDAKVGDGSIEAIYRACLRSRGGNSIEVRKGVSRHLWLSIINGSINPTKSAKHDVGIFTDIPIYKFAPRL